MSSVVKSQSRESQLKPSASVEKLPVTSATLTADTTINGVKSSSTAAVDKYASILPDFSQSNAAVMRRHEYCANTRAQALSSMDAWLKDTKVDKSRVLLLKADAGMGKTTLLSELCVRYQQQVAAYHLFSYNSPNLNHNHLKPVMLWFVRALSHTIKDYRSSLPSQIQQLVHTATIDDVINELIYAPLQASCAGATNMMIVIDALDECNIADRETLYEFVNDFSARAPSWLHLCVSMRCDNQLENLLASVDVIELRQDSAENMADMKRMMRESLAGFMDRISLDGGLTQLAKKTHGLALCAGLYSRQLRQQKAGTTVALREIDVRFATGIDGVLSTCLSSFKKSLQSGGGTGSKASKRGGSGGNVSDQALRYQHEQQLRRDSQRKKRMSEV